jgi:hypothetical protein
MQTQSGSRAADVYADDLRAEKAWANSSPDQFIFLIDADAAPDSIGRIANIFTITNDSPQSAYLERPCEGVLHFVIEYVGMDARTADCIRRKLGQLTSVLSVEVQHSRGSRSDIEGLR